MTNSDEIRRQWIVRDEAFLIPDENVCDFMGIVHGLADEAGVQLGNIGSPMSELIHLRLKGFDVNIAGFLGALRIEGYEPLEVGGQFNDGGSDERAYRG